MRIAIAIPTRGMLMTRTIDAVQQAIAYAQMRHTVQVVPQWCFSYALPIPDSHNICLYRALDQDIDAVWFVEEDVVPPLHSLAAMIDLLEDGADLAFVDYPMPGGHRCYHTDAAGQVMWTGFGCTLIKSDCFTDDTLPLRTDISATWVGETLEWKNVPAVYGSFDILFGWTLCQQGKRLEVVEHLRCEHLRLVELGARERNHGLHTISSL